MVFRVNARNIFLTYAQCSISGSDLLEHLFDLEPNAVFIRTAEEKHEDGNPHLHALIRWATKRDIRGERHFDLEGSHPKIEACRNWKKSLNYLSKGGVYFDYSAEGYEAEEEGIPDPEDFASKTEFLRACLGEHVPFGYADAFWKLSERVDKHIHEEGGGHIVVPELNFRQPVPNGSTAVIGPTGVGKTTWALRHAKKPALLISHIEDLKALNNDTQSIVFDDMDFRHWPRTSQIHLVDTNLPRSINVRYGVVHIPANIQKIFTANPTSPPFLDDDAIKRRVLYINL